MRSTWILQVRISVFLRFPRLTYIRYAGERRFMKNHRARSQLSTSSTVEIARHIHVHGGPHIIPLLFRSPCQTLSGREQDENTRIAANTIHCQKKISVALTSHVTVIKEVSYNISTRLDEKASPERSGYNWSVLSPVVAVGRGIRIGNSGAYSLLHCMLVLYVLAR